MAMDKEQVQAHADRIQNDGYTIVENAIELDFIDQIANDLTRLERELGIKPRMNVFEGNKTTRVLNLLAHGKTFEAIPVHPNILPIVETVLDGGLLVSTLTSVAIGPGELAQPIHTDDQLIPLKKPHQALICNTMWALTDFTEENGATRIVPKSHLEKHNPEFMKHYPSVPAVMKKGSVLIWHGSLWHGGGANVSKDVRIGIAMNYCAGYIRQQENQQLGIPREIVAGFEPRLRELVGYGVYRGLLGNIVYKSPEQALLNG
ncbi:MAG: phytanoyl-CoA dioxygenase family protein [Candidatus Binataceae bacterium]